MEVSFGHWHRKGDTDVWIAILGWSLRRLRTNDRWLIIKCHINPFPRLLKSLGFKSVPMLIHAMANRYTAHPFQATPPRNKSDRRALFKIAVLLHIKSTILRREETMSHFTVPMAPANWKGHCNSTERRFFLSDFLILCISHSSTIIMFREMVSLEHFEFSYRYNTETFIVHLHHSSGKILSTSTASGSRYKILVFSKWRSPRHFNHVPPSSVPQNHAPRYLFP